MHAHNRCQHLTVHTYVLVYFILCVPCVVFESWTMGRRILFVEVVKTLYDSWPASTTERRETRAIGKSYTYPLTGTPSQVSMLRSYFRRALFSLL